MASQGTSSGESLTVISDVTDLAVVSEVVNDLRKIAKRKIGYQVFILL